MSTEEEDCELLDSRVTIPFVRAFSETLGVTVRYLGKETTITQKRKFTFDWGSGVVICTISPALQQADYTVLVDRAADYSSHQKIPMTKSLVDREREYEKLTARLRNNLMAAKLRRL